MDAALIVSATLLGLAGTPHCAAMCAAPCAALCGREPTRTVAFQAARLLGYSAAGALAAGSVGWLATMAQWSPALRPVWVVLQALVLTTGLWMLVQGRLPAWIGALGRAPATGAWQPVKGPLRAAAVGSLWVAWPCGLLQSALLLASLTGSATSGAGAMAGFALASSGGLLAAPWIAQRLRRGSPPASRERHLARLTGALLVAGSGFALTRGLWHPIAVFCGLA